ncbi:MAG: hypothetical protein AB7L18_04485 [Hyphomicrobiaceae bacterium]
MIPLRSNRKVLRYDKKLYREPNQNEHSFGRLKDFRRIASRFDRNVKDFMVGTGLCPTPLGRWNSCAFGVSEAHPYAQASMGQQHVLPVTCCSRWPAIDRRP